jgi:hypothetical protein
MSDLEQRAKPILLPLCLCQRRIADLSHSKQATVSRWTTKTALMLHVASGFGPDLIPLEAYPALRLHHRRLPSGISVFAFQTPDLADDLLPVSGLESQHWLVLRKDRVAPFERLNKCKISLRVGSLQLLVAYCADPVWALAGWRTVHIPLWPTRLRLSYEARLRTYLVKPRQESAMALFHISLAISEDLTQQELVLMPRPPFEAMLEKFFEPAGRTTQ